jgi:hypothetical protein
MKKVMQIILASALTVLSASALAQSYTDTVWEQLQDWYDTYSEDGYSVENYVIGMLDEDETDSWTFWLDASQDYTIVGVCDEDCGDIDLTLYDDDGDMVDEDTMTDDYPIVSVSPRRDAAYTIDVDMYDCDVEPCAFGIAIFYD